MHWPFLVCMFGIFHQKKCRKLKQYFRVTLKNRYPFGIVIHTYPNRNKVKELLKGGLNFAKTFSKAIFLKYCDPSATNCVLLIFIHYVCISVWLQFHIKVWNYICNFVLWIFMAFQESCFWTLGIQNYILPSGHSTPSIMWKYITQYNTIKSTLEKSPTPKTLKTCLKLVFLTQMLDGRKVSYNIPNFFFNANDYEH
jgi:hypothetical protein